jgi:hypothetical protein
VPEYFTLPELRALPQLGDTARYTNERCEAAAAWAVSLIEREVGQVSFVHREHTETHDGGRDVIVLEQPWAQNTAALVATEDGTAVTDQLRISSGVLRRFSAGGYVPRAWSPGIGNVVVTFEAGYTSVPPGDIKEAALQLTRERLLDTNSDVYGDARTVELVNEIGGTSRRGEVDEDHPTGIPTIDSVIVGWRRKLDVFGFA